MKKSILFLIFTLITSLSYGQVIRGHVFDRETRELIDYVSVYVNGTFPGTTTFTGNILFNQDLASNSNNRKEYEKRRKKTYLGSSKHFFTALWTDHLAAEGFRVENPRTADALRPDEVVTLDSQGKKYLHFSEDLEISYNYYQSTVHFLQGRAFFDRDGFFEPEAILWYGHMSESRIADWLPYEYAPGQ
jgi:hypothetical protein